MLVYGKKRLMKGELENKKIKEYPWMVLDDFNVIRKDSKRIGSNPRLLISMSEFNDFLDNCRSVDLHSNGPPMSWCIGQEGVSHTLAKLDRVINLDKPFLLWQN